MNHAVGDNRYGSHLVAQTLDADAAGPVDHRDG